MTTLLIAPKMTTLAVQQNVRNFIEENEINLPEPTFEEIQIVRNFDISNLIKLGENAKFVCAAKRFFQREDSVNYCRVSLEILETQCGGTTELDVPESFVQQWVFHCYLKRIQTIAKGL